MFTKLLIAGFFIIVLQFLFILFSIKKSRRTINKLSDKIAVLMIKNQTLEIQLNNFKVRQENEEIINRADSNTIFSELQSTKDLRD